MAGFLIFACLFIEHFLMHISSSPAPASLEIGDHVVFAIFYMGSMTMFLLSSLLHAFFPRGEVFAPRLATFDYIGISVRFSSSLVFP
jgi:predicted membrane channel-forming protein YqfA (hemolysin III family)